MGARGAKVIKDDPWLRTEGRDISLQRRLGYALYCGELEEMVSGLESCWVSEHGPGATSSPIMQVASIKEGPHLPQLPCPLFCDVCFKIRARRKDSS